MTDNKRMTWLTAAYLAVIGLPFLVSACGNAGGCNRFTDCDYDQEASSDEIEADALSVDAANVESPVFDSCTEDCSGHEAGFEWARDHDVSDSEECGGMSPSFTEGCEAFAEGRQVLADEQAEAQWEDDEELDRF